MELEQIKRDPIGMILSFSVPAILSMVLTALITVADGAFIGNFVGKDSIASVNLGLPVVYLFLGVGLMVSVGGAAMAGMARGSGDVEGCRRIFRQTVFTAALLALLTALAVWLCFEPMLDVLGAEGRVRVDCRTYYLILLPELVLMIVNSTLSMFVRGEGNPRFALKANAACTALNVLLVGLFTGVLGWGVAGVAWASVLAALVSMGMLLWYFLRRAEVYRLGAFSFSWEVFRRALLNGSSEMIGELSTGIAMFAYNFVILRQAGVDGVTAFTVVGYTAYLFSMVVVGFGQGSSPLASFSFGAGERALARRIHQMTSRLVSAAGAAAFLLTATLAGRYGHLFVDSKTVLDFIRSGAALFALSFLCSGFNAVTSFYFTATGRALESAVISLSRGLVVLLVCIFLLPALWGMTGVWLAAPVTEGITLVLSLCYLRRRT